MRSVLNWKRSLLAALILVLCMFFYIHTSQSIKSKIFTQAINATAEQLNHEKVAQDDPRLVHLIKKYYLQPPSTLPYVLKDEKRKDYSQAGQSTFVDTLFKGSVNGFFVESGALDGEFFSNSLFFEKRRQWTGLLIEANPHNYKLLMSKHRKSFSINACLSPYPYPAKIPLMVSKIFGHSKLKMDKTIPDKFKLEEIQMIQCFPLYSILLACGYTTIDYLSLDMEGVELDVLRTLPWTKININVIQIEYNRIKEGKEVLIDFLLSKGYTDLPIVNKPGWMQDIIFIKNGFHYNETSLDNQ